jgi:hypothetical protein
MACGCKKKAPVVTNQEQTQNVTIKLTESNQGSTQTQEDLVNKIVDKLNNLDNDNK